jgi:EAL domain-containing protein (putative c-di-GMP-specific phosphodiesterase class I)
MSDQHADEIRTALDRGEFALVYQPEVDLFTGTVVALEALLRWRHPSRGELGPDAFVAAAERSGAIVELGGWVLDEGLRALASWQAALPGLDVTLCVNVSPVQLEGDQLLADVDAALRKHDLAGERLCLELTENAPVTGDLDRAARTLGQLRERGVRAALDDLAAGFSTLSRLRWLAVDVVKLDRTLISGVDRDRRAATIVSAVVGLALALGMEVVAEGVETAGEAAALAELGCSQGQGHYFGRPVPGSQVPALLRDRGRFDTP